jgi:cytochrome oxidase Cu insertion factor (SCO1/SenC/PrrC family)
LTLVRQFLVALVIGAVSLTGAEIPRQAPEYAFALPSGQQELLSKYKGKVIVLEFLLTTCPHCQNSCRILSKLNSELGPKGFQPLGVAINPEADVNDFVKKFGVNFPIGKGSLLRAAARLY